MPDGNSDVVPPESIPNSEVKRVSGDGSVGSPHVRVAHRQAPNSKKPAHLSGLFSFLFSVQNLTLLLFITVHNSQHRICLHSCLYSL